VPMTLHTAVPMELAAVPQAVSHSAVLLGKTAAPTVFTVSKKMESAVVPSAVVLQAGVAAKTRLVTQLAQSAVLTVITATREASV